MDAGHTDLFARNAEKLGIDLSEVDAAVLSHAHYDHSGGFEEFFRINNKAKVYVRDCALLDYYTLKEEAARYIGIPETVVRDHSERFFRVAGKVCLAEGVYLIPHNTPGMQEIGIQTELYRKTEAGFIPDDFCHEQSLVLEISEGLIVFNSCSHGGIVNIIREVREALPHKKIYAYIGGFHLKSSKNPKSMFLSVEEVEQLGRKLLDLGIENVYTGHCTGEEAYEILKRIMGRRLHPLSSGIEMEY